MCSYCGCEAEPVVKALMDDHVEIVALMSEILDAVEEGSSERAAKMTTRLASYSADTQKLKKLAFFISSYWLVRRPRKSTVSWRTTADCAPASQIRPSLCRLITCASSSSSFRHHAEIEETDLFPFALQVMPPQSWSIIRTGRLSKLSHCQVWVVAAIMARGPVPSVHHGPTVFSCALRHHDRRLGV